MEKRESGSFLRVLPLFLALLLVTRATAAPAEEQEPEMMLPGCGIMYPRGYDPNTVGQVEGRVAALRIPEEGPVVILIEAGSERYSVLAAPAWFWEEKKVPIHVGSVVRVKGSKTMGADGELYLIAREATVEGQADSIVFRDARGRPVWSGCGPRGCGRSRR